MSKLLFILCTFLAAPGYGVAQATVRIEPDNLQGPRLLQEQTKAVAIRDYLRSWQSFKAAFEQNRADLLTPDFTGTAKDKLSATIRQQAELGIRTRYQDLSHDIQIVFYSPEGLSIELTDEVEYNVQVLDHDAVKTTQHVRSRYIMIMTPAEVRWRVRVFEAASE
jgi:hypothetical protein